jgi:hypothetical protein
MFTESLRIVSAVSLVLQFASPVASRGATEDTVRPLPIVASAGIGPTMDVATDGDLLFAVGQGRLSVLDIHQPAKPKLLGTLAGLGQVRQVTVYEGVAYVTAREDGLFLIDVRRPDSPQLLSHYDTIELATGIAVSGPVAFVACRNCGVELVDVTDGRQPRHLSTIRVGEAQSVAVRDGILYAGVWATREVAICDVRNPRRPRLLAKAPLDGYGDGVAVQGHYCYAATGHHRRGLPSEKPGDPGYGGGHGLEIFDVADPGQPQFVGRVKLPPLYRLGYDMWRVTVGERFAFVADTFNGVFVIDITEPQAPRVVARGQLPQVPERGDPSPTAGIAVAEGTVFAAGAWTDLHVLDAPQLATRPAPEPDRGVTIPPSESTAAVPGCRVYRPDGQVHSVALHGNVALAAAGAAGIHVVEVQPDWRCLAVVPTGGFAFDVRVCGDRVFVAEGKGGLSIWAREGGTLRRLGGYDARGQSVKQVVVPPPGKYALIHAGPNTLQVLDVSNPVQPKQVFEDRRLGLFYTAPIADGLLDGRFACCHWHVTGLYWYDLVGGPQPQYTGRNYAHRIGSQNGVAFWGQRALLVAGGTYSLVDSEESRPPHELPRHGVEGVVLSGKPTVAGHRLYLSERYLGQVQALDVTDIQRPRLLGQLQLTEHPGIVCDPEGTAFIPAGYGVSWRGRWFIPRTRPTRTAPGPDAGTLSVYELAVRETPRDVRRGGEPGDDSGRIFGRLPVQPVGAHPTARRSRPSHARSPPKPVQSVWPRFLAARRFTRSRVTAFPNLRSAVQERD